MSTAILVSILSAAVIENEIDEDGDIYASDGLDYPTWISIDTDRKLLCFFARYTPSDWSPDLLTDRLQAVANSINGSHLLVQFHWCCPSLVGHYWMTFDGRLDPRHFVKMLRRFSSAFASGAEAFVDALKR